MCAAVPVWCSTLSYSITIIHVRIRQVDAGDERRRRRRGPRTECCGAGSPCRTSMSASSRSGTLSGSAVASIRASTAAGTDVRRVVPWSPAERRCVGARRSDDELATERVVDVGVEHDRARACARGRTSVRAADVHGMPSTSSRSSSSMTRLSCTTRPPWRVSSPAVARDLDRRRCCPTAGRQSCAADRCEATAVGAAGPAGGEHVAAPRARCTADAVHVS